MTTARIKKIGHSIKDDGLGIYGVESPERVRYWRTPKSRPSMRPRQSKFASNHFVYIVRCRNGDLYTGYTKDPVRRLEQHNQGKASKFTRSRLPVELVYLERFDTSSEALRREISIKQLSRKDKLRIISANKRALHK